MIEDHNRAYKGNVKTFIHTYVQFLKISEKNITFPWKIKSEFRIISWVEKISLTKAFFKFSSFL